MTKVQVTIDIPDDCEVTSDTTLSSAAWVHVANEQPKHGRMFFYVRIREKWQWPAWLKVAAIAMDRDGSWWTHECIPKRCDEDGQWRGNSLWIIEQKELDFTPPTCTDWRQSLRLNPNREANP